jgi:hypothetical protein
MVSFKLFRLIKYIDVKVHQLYNLNFLNFKIVIFQFKSQKIPSGNVPKGVQRIKRSKKYYYLFL